MAAPAGALSGTGPVLIKRAVTEEDTKNIQQGGYYLNRKNIRIASLHQTSKEAARRRAFLLFSLIPLYFIVLAFFLQPPAELLPGLFRLIREPDFLITDYFVVGGVGAAFLNAGLLTLFSIALVYVLGMEMTGHTITSACLIFGFSLFGKNLLNIWAVLAGVWLYARYHKKSFSDYIYVGLYGTCLSPIITQLMFVLDLPVSLRMPFALLVGLVIGFVLPPLSTHTHYAHKGYSLYNVGFSAGIIATVLVSLLKSFGVEIESRLIWYTGSNFLFLGILSVLFLGMALIALCIGGRSMLRAYLRLLCMPGLGGSDYLRDFGGSAVCFNMGINGFAASLLVVLAGGDLNGPTIGGIFTIVGFSATGKHIRNILPIMAGVWLGGLVKHWNIHDPSSMLAFLFSTTLAPIAGQFGVLCGLLAGFLHSSVVLNVGVLYGGMNLYNNGFAGGLVAVFLVPVIQSFIDRRARAKEDDAL